MGLTGPVPDGQTLLGEDEKDGLRIPTITTRAELDEYEQQNIEAAMLWIMGRSFRPEVIFSEDHIRNLHRRMFGKVWSWAGTFRQTDKNIGADKWRISIELKLLLDDARYWHEQGIYDPDELAIRFKHRIVSIHCFPNGNGRHSRLMADIIVEKLYRRPAFRWGGDAPDPAATRSAYLAAVRKADQGDYGPLLVFARS
ncbi:mobile mystery protein B [Candidatus Pollutiaquabacter sp.]|jgi:Fic-DOC domain mobile mystery protein B|uniref:mobile mystery protein B n=1 Tax=Candidatus Pollutiaquabacter sp. TaxID=3416354 RepID=UPI003C846DD7|nr:mobile mystery protein B [Bacteroidota bacterium]